MTPKQMFTQVFKHWQLKEATIRPFVGGWTGAVITETGEEKFILWIGEGYRVFNRDQAVNIHRAIGVWLQQQKEASNVH